MEGHLPELIIKYINEDEWSEIVFQLSHNSYHIKVYNKISNLIKDINKKIKLSKQIITSIALVFFHKYYLVNPDTFQSITTKELVLVSSACILISTKYTNNFIHLDFLAETVCEILKIKDKKEKQAIKDQIATYEYAILSSCGFDLNIELPYRWIKVLKDKITQNINCNNVTQLVTLWIYYINDSFILPLSLRYDGITITLACFSILNSQFGLGVDVEKFITENNIYTSISHITQCVSMMNTLLFNNNAKEKDKQCKQINNSNSSIEMSQTVS